MGLPVLVIGESGSGKSYSVKNFDPEEVGIFAVEKSLLPFKKSFKVAKNATYEIIMKCFKGGTNLKKYIIDDSQYLLVNELFDKAKDTGYGKFTDIAVHFRNLIHFINHQLPDDVIVYFLHHSETDEDGRAKVKTVGKMLDNALTVEGCFDIVLLASVENKEHFFITQSDGYTTAKSPEGMFDDLKIPNDLNYVDTKIREYYGL